MKKQPKKRVPSKKAAVFAFPRLKISHHRHSGKILSHRHTSYPTLTMIILLAGVMLVGLSRMSLAEDMTVTASLLGPAPTTAATIDTPADGARTSTKPISVSGTCPASTYVKLLRNSVESGVAICDVSGRYSLQTDLFVGANELEAQVYNTTDVPGPASSKITVYFDPPVPAPVPTTPPSSPTTGDSGSTNQQPTSTTQPTSQSPIAPVLLTSQFRFSGSYVGQPASFDFNVSGGQGPYTVTVDWGDGTQKTITVATAGSFTIEHIYRQAGGNQGTYPIIVTVTDGRGAQSLVQIIAFVRDRPAEGGLPPAAGTQAGPTTGGSEGIVRYVWSMYFVIFLMVASFWLGELRELKHLKPKINRTRHV